MKAHFLLIASMILPAASVSAAPTLLTGVPANSYLASPTGPQPSIGGLFNFDELTPNSTFNSAQYSAQGVTITSPDGLQVLPFSTQTAPNELFDSSVDGSANIRITTPATDKLGIGIADSDGVTITLQALDATGSGLGSPFSISIPAASSNPGNGYFVVSDNIDDIHGLQILQPSGSANYSGLAIDDLQIGVAAIPEPASLALLGIGTALLGAIRLGKRC